MEPGSDHHVRAINRALLAERWDVVIPFTPNDF
jgi:hypothetical protein